MKMYSIASSCPKCGAPIYAPKEMSSFMPPVPVFTCDCVPHKTIKRSFTDVEKSEILDGKKSDLT